MSEQDDREFEALKRDYAGVRKHEPAEHIDAAIRAAARRHAPQRRLRVWSAALASAACVGLAVVLVPALLVEAPDPAWQQPQAELMIRVANEEAERRAREETVTQKAREARRARAFAAPPPSASPVPYKDRAESTSPTEPADMEATEDAYVLDEKTVDPPASVNPDDELRALYEELAAADEPAWRRRLLELRAAGREPLAAALLEDFRARFDRPASLTLDDLAREETLAQERR